jgi:hypothetical protein
LIVTLLCEKVTVRGRLVISDKNPTHGHGCRIHIANTRRPTSAVYIAISSISLYRTSLRSFRLPRVRTINGKLHGHRPPQTRTATQTLILRSSSKGHMDLERVRRRHMYHRGSVAVQPPDCICCVAAARPTSHRSRASRPIASREAAGVGSPRTPLADAQPHVRGHVPHASKLRARSHGLRLPCGGADLCDTSAGRRHGRHRLKWNGRCRDRPYPLALLRDRVVKVRTVVRRVGASVPSRGQRAHHSAHRSLVW